MIHGGKLGGSTITGIHFERRVSLKDALAATGQFTLTGNDVFLNDKKIAEVYLKHELYKKFLAPKKINHQEILSKRLLPDQAVFVFSNKTLFIIEIKFQKVAGSVDEKLQTCDFKLKQYKKLVKPLGIQIKYAYVLNDWFKHAQYKDTLDYVKSVGCDYFFNEIPFVYLGIA